MIRNTILAALGVTVATLPAAAEGMRGDPVAGLDFARGHCAACHHVEPERSVASFSREIAFHEMAADPLLTETAIRVFLQTPHIEMPDFILSAEQTDDVIAYILSLEP